MGKYSARTRIGPQLQSGAGNQADGGASLCGRPAAHLLNRRHHVDEADGLAHPGTCSEQGGEADDQRNLQDGVVKISPVAHLASFAEGFSVVGRDDEQSPVEDALLPQRLGDSTDVGVDIQKPGVVQVDRRLEVFGADAPAAITTLQSAVEVR